MNWTVEQYRHFVATGEKPMNKYHAVRCEEDGIKFDSKTERDYYLHLKALDGVTHIDAHPVFTLPAGIRFTADFLVWRDGAPPVAVDIKGMTPKTDFWRLKKLFDATHPAGPLKVVRRKGKGWEEIDR